MTDLRTYIQDQNTKLFDSLGAFFAFSNTQFDEQKKEGVKYASVGAGLIVPKENVKKLVDGLDATSKSKVAKDLKENSMSKIMHREFANYECQIVGSYADAKEALEDYGFSDEDFKKEWAVYWDLCVENNWF